MTSILSIPPEIMAEIFQWAVIYFLRNGHRCNLAWRSPPQNDPPINIACVCRVWHKIALSQASLWASFEVYDAYTVEDVQRAMPRMQTWLQRSSPSAPLSFKIALPIDTAKSVDDADCEAADALIREVNKHKSRWESVTIYLTGVNVKELTLDALPMLQELRYEAYATAPHRLDLSTIPFLRDLSITGPVDLLAIPSNLILTGLRVLRLEIGGDHSSLSKENCLAILKCTPRLKDLYVKIGEHGKRIPEDCIRLPEFDGLHISWTYPGNGCDALSLLKGIESPSLTMMSVDFPWDDRDFDMGHLVDMDMAVHPLECLISRCKVSLAALRVTARRGELDITGLLRLSPDLKKLYLRCEWFPDGFYEKLSQMKYKSSGKTRPPLCPRLELILLDETFREESEDEFDDEAFMRNAIDPKTVKMIWQRWNVPVAQRSLRAVWLGSIDHRRSKKLKQMKEEGLDFSAHWW